MPKARTILILTAFLMIAAGRCYCAEGSETLEMSGRVTSVDWVGSVIVVDGSKFFVEPGAEITKGVSKIDFSEINISDPVTIEYYKDSDGSLRATTIYVTYSGELPV